MKRKPDSIVALGVIFCIGLAISGFTSVFAGQERPHTNAGYALVMPAVK